VLGWNPSRRSFEVIYDRKPAKSKQATGGIDFSQEKAPLVVDFTGSAKDEGPLEMLFLGPDGKLLVRNSRVDSDPESQEGRTRLDRWRTWRERFELLRRSQPTGTTGGVPPKLPGPR